ncbi:MAG TPA: HD domain-containing phosphohydrolase [Solirubrobacteraceae bacterium]|jgi:putative nucleotidyltransferase with HDIG domain|nr:HD domain-containing phosphohydrolase [Solirubrobacteraceae bacterium]
MLRPGADDRSRLHRRDVLASAVTLLTLVVCALAIALSPASTTNSLSAILGVAAVAAGVLVAGEAGGLAVSASFIVFVLAAALLGPASATAAAVIAELAATLTMRTRWRASVFNNLPAAMLPAVAAAVIIRSLASKPADNVGFYLAVTLAGAVALVLSYAMFAALRRLVFPSADQFGMGTLLEFVPGGVLSILLAVAGVGITLKVGNAGIAFALAAVFAFSYMTHLLQQSRQRAKQYVALSWGVLAGLMRSLDIRDERTARHSAAVARFARDIAHTMGMGEAECELAHTAGLLHDIGRFALSDRVAERGRTLTEEDWVAIQSHPELGADMLRDLGMYGPVAEIVLAHHERIDGRGYPSGLAENEIPEIAKIISVAEVYDTLTASDTYRTQMSSFEALTELRRVAGTQVDARYVDVLANLLRGEGVEYRHADMADFDVELDMERRINEAGAGA